MATITLRSAKGSPLTNAEVDDNFSNLNTELGQKESASNKGQASGYASLDGSGKVPASQLPSYVDDVVEAANFLSLPGTGETGKIYVVLDTNKTYRWSGSAYVEISASPGSTDAVTEGSTNLYFTNARARGALSGNAPISYNSTSGAISHAVSGVTAGSYGSSTSVPVITVDATGHVTGVSTSSISGSLTFTGDVTGSGSTGSSTALTLANSGVVAGTYTKVTVDAKGRVTTGTSLASGDLPTYTGTITSSQVTTALGFTPYNSSNPSGYLTDAMRNRGSVAQASVDSATLDGFYTQSNPGDSDGVLVFNAGGSLGPLQMRFKYTGLFEFRNKTDSANWNSWKQVLHSGNYSSGYFKTINGSSIIGTGDLTVSDSTKLPLSGGTLTGGLTGTLGYFSASTQGTPILRLKQEDTSTGYYLLQGLSGSTEVIRIERSGTIVSPTGRFQKNQTAGDYTTAALWTESYGNTATGVAFHISGNVGKFLEMRTNGILYWNGDTVIHSGNYNSWAPSLTGTGASGTWSINITGNAATSTVMRYVGYAGDVGNLASAGTGIISNYNTTGAWTGAPSGMSYGSVYHLGGSSGGSILSLQIAADINHNSSSSTKQLWFRTSNNLGFQNDWKELLHSGNYSSYALPLSGGTLTGGLGVGAIIGSRGTALSVSGSSNSSAIVAKSSDYATVSSILPHSSSWTYYGTGVYYNNGAWVHASADSNNALFGINGSVGGSWWASSTGTASWNVASGTALWNAAGTWVGSLNAAAGAQVNSSAILTSANYSSYALPLSGGTISGTVSINGGSSQPLNLTTSSSSPWGFGLTRSDANVSSKIFLHNGSGSWAWVYEHNPVFYNGGAYSAFLNSSNYSSYALPLSGGTVTGFLGVGGNPGSDDGGWGARLNVGGNPHARIDARCANDGIVTTVYSHQGQNRGYVGTMSNHRLALGVNGSEVQSVYSGYSESIGSYRAPIFYDSGDTGYYCDPNSTSQFNQARFVNRIAVGNGSTPYLNTGTAGIWFSNGGGASHFAGSHDSDTSWWGVYTNSAWRSWLTGGGSWISTGDQRAPIFYDYNDTGYYCNPNDWSLLYGLRTYYIQNNYDVSTDHPFGLYFANGGSTAYAIYRESGSWTHPYPDLRIAFHTGIKLGANSSYQGVRFYTDYDMSSQVMSVNNGSDPLGGGNVYVNSALQAGGSLRAPIFYDSNDTGYYLDGASTSRLNYVVPNRIKCVNNTNNEPRWDFSAYVVEAQHWYGNNSSMTMYLGESNYINIRNTADVHGDVRSPVYYDRNNTAYYLDPTSTTAIRTVGSWRADAADWDGEFNGKIQYHASHWYFQYASLAIFRNSGGSNVLQIDQSGNLTAQGNVTAYSDRRLKENVSTLSGASDYLARIDAKTFRWKSDGRNDIGFIAQDVEEAGLPEFVIMADTYNPATGETAEPIKSLDYGRMVSVLWQAVKEQKSQIAAMSAEINSLKERLH